ncbi:MAG: hypothetical protein F2813_01850 [Actinobacteria bacterium]|nr:hypothetical protein [Actinomycetota bacterium]
MTEANEQSLDQQAGSRLRRLNVIVGIAAAAQAIVLLAIAKPASLPVNMTYMLGPPGEGKYGSPTELFGLRIDIAVALFLLLAAADHLIVASPWANRWYTANVARGINPARWWEYSISASLMVVLIAMLTGISQATALIAIFGVNAAMILLGLVMEYANENRDTVDWRPFIYGCIVGAVPWIAITIQLFPLNTSGGHAPTFVYFVFFSLFLLFNCFAVNMWLQYRGKGRWASPVHAERVYLWLSLIAKSVLAWQVYGGALAGS